MFACVVTRAWQVDLVNKCVLPVISYHENQERAAEVLGQASCGQKKLTVNRVQLCALCAMCKSVAQMQCARLAIGCT